MPRRQNIKAHVVIHEEDRSTSDADEELPLSPETPRQPNLGREPLSEIANPENAPQQSANIIVEIDLSKFDKNPTTVGEHEGQKDRVTEDCLDDKNDKENIPEVLEDDFQSILSPAAKIAREYLRKSSYKESKQIFPNKASPASASPAVIVARRELRNRPNSDSTRPEESGVGLGHTSTQKGAMKSTASEICRSLQTKATNIDATGVEGIEDNMEALDALQDVVAEIEAAIPIAMAMASPSKTTHGEYNYMHSPPTSLATTHVRLSPAQAAEKEDVTSETTTVWTTPSQTNIDVFPKLVGDATGTIIKKALANDAGSEPAGKRLSVSAGRSKKPCGSTCKASFVPEKYLKPAAASGFSLPGEAVSARLKNQREQRQKHMSLATTLDRHQGTKAKGSSGISSATVRGTSFVGPNDRARALPRNATVKTATRKANLNYGRSTVERAVVTNDSSKSKAKNFRKSATTSAYLTGNTRPRDKKFTDNVPNSLAGVFNPPTTENDINSPTERQKDGIQDRTFVSHPRNRTTPSSRPAKQSSMQQVKPNAATHANRACATRTPGSAVVSTARSQPALVERKAREEATRRAREEAAERGRKASRDWAERQRQRMGAKKGATNTTGLEIAEH